MITTTYVSVEAVERLATELELSGCSYTQLMLLQRLLDIQEDVEAQEQLLLDQEEQERGSNGSDY